MFRELKNLFGKESHSSIVTVEKIHHVFAYGRLHDICGLALPDEGGGGLGALIDWQPEPQPWTIKVEIKGFKLGDEITIPPHIKWSANPLFAYAGIVDDRVELRAGQEDASAWFLCPKAHPADVAKIETIFRFWYKQFGLPESLATAESKHESFRTWSDSPFRGFKVLAVRHPNHLNDGQRLWSARDLAIGLSREMDVEWFGNTADLTHFAVTDIAPGPGENAASYGFDFGPYDETSDEFSCRYTVVVRPTAGGGFMLLIKKEAVAYGDVIAELFDRVIRRGGDNGNATLS